MKTETLFGTDFGCKTSMVGNKVFVHMICVVINNGGQGFAPEHERTLAMC